MKVLGIIIIIVFVVKVLGILNKVLGYGWHGRNTKIDDGPYSNFY